MIPGIIAARALGITVWYPAIGAGGVFSADVAGVFCFAGCFIRITASRAAGCLIADVAAVRQGDGFVADFSGRAGRVPASGCVARIGAAITGCVAALGFILNRIIFGAGLALLGIGVGYRALFGAVAFPTIGAWGTF